MADRRRDDFPNNFVGDLVPTARSFCSTRVHIKAVADLLGHSSVAITGIFTGTPPMTQRGRRLTASRDSSGSLYKKLLLSALLSIPHRGINSVTPDCRETAL